MTVPFHFHEDGFHVAESDIEIVVGEALKDENPLGLDTADPYGVGEMNAEDCIKRALQGMAPALATEVARSLDRYVRQERDDLTTDIDPLTAELLAHLGVDPLAVAWLSAVCCGIIVHDDAIMSQVCEIDGQMRPDMPLCDTSVTIGEDSWWKSKGTLMVFPGPHSALTASVGRKLSALVSHPVLDRHDLVIHAVDGGHVDGTGNTFPWQLRCGEPKRMLTATELLHLVDREQFKGDPS